MAAPATTIALPAPRQIAKGIADAVPSELSKSPLLGVLGVITGAGIVTLTGRMLTLGLADLGFHLLAWSCVAALLLIAVLRRSPLNYGELSFVQQSRTAPRDTK